VLPKKNKKENVKWKSIIFWKWKIMWAILQ
jgi:hypothetical protein